MSTFSMTDSMKSVGSSAFEQCSGLTSFIFPSKAIDIGSRAFCSTGLASLNVATGE